MTAAYIGLNNLAYLHDSMEEMTHCSSTFKHVGSKFSSFDVYFPHHILCLLHSLHSSAHFLLPGSKRVDTPTRLTIEAETVLDGSVGGRRRRRERQGEGLQGGPHNTHKERPRLRPGYVIWRKDRKE